MDTHQGGQAQSANHGIPIGTQYITDGIVAFGRENGDKVHRAVKQQEHHKARPGNGHDELPRDGRKKQLIFHCHGRNFGAKVGN